MSFCFKICKFINDMGVVIAFLENEQHKLNRLHWTCMSATLYVVYPLEFYDHMHSGRST